MKIMKLRQNAVKNPRQNAMEYGLQAKRNGGLEQNAVMLKQNARGESGSSEREKSLSVVGCNKNEQSSPSMAGREMKQQGDDVASWWPWNVFEVLVSYYGDVMEDPYEVTVARWRSRVAVRSSPPTHQILPTPPGSPRRPSILVLPGQPIPFGRPYRTQPNEIPCTGHLRKLVRKRVRALPSGRLASRYPPDYSSSDHFSSDDSSSDSSSDSPSGYSSDTSSGHSILDSSFETPAVSFAGLLCKRRRSPVVLAPLATPVLGALSPVRADILPPCKRIRGSVSATAQDDSTGESYDAYTEPDIDSDFQAGIDADTAAAEVAAVMEADVGVEVSIGSDGEDEVEEEAEYKDRGSIEIGVDRIIEGV
ncbi:hypothetical protein Tco_0502724 [Tanacetum coccineum]